MTGTDKAFIRIYEDRPSDSSQNVVGPLPQGRPEDPASGSVPYVSQYFTAASPLPTPLPRRPVSSPPVETVAVSPDRQRPSPPQRFTLGTIAGVTGSVSTFRVDGAEALASPHLPGSPQHPINTTQPSPHREPGAIRRELRQTATPSQPRVLRPFRPQWEVDGFALPEICARLQSESAVGLAELFRAVLMRAWRGRPVVAISAFDRGEGTTTVTLCLARLAATFATRVGVLDGNLSHPSVCDMLGLTVRSSWTTATPDHPLTECAVGAGDDRMVILPLVSPQPESPTAGLRKQASATLQSLRNCFDLILIDTGPIYQAAHLWFAAGMERSIDAAVVVRDVRRTSPIQLEDICLRIRQAGVQDVSIVENFETPTLAAG